ncbi:lipase family protein [Cohnella yongneupensis]|uniref:Lipase family protein n=1 Tax=Cohnella yongneupensis TaxID=425006 RepID=A0ABW0R111_9BACL
MGRLSAGAYDNRMAMFLAAVCSQTYEQYGNASGQFVVPAGYKVAESFEAKSFGGQWEKFGFILESDDRIILAFRGTSSTTDWISDAIASQEKYKCVKEGGLSHRGISDIYYSARPVILPALSKLSSSRKRLHITGHSLGGALAALSAPDAAANAGFQSPVVYSFGAPRVGDPTFVHAYSDRVGYSYRVYNQLDAVPKLPPQTYKPPRKDTTYRYLHVKEGVPLLFNNGSVSANHVIGSYYRELAKSDPAYAAALDRNNPGFAPSLA